jgi:ribonuclease J
MLIDRDHKRIVELPIISTRGSFYAKTSTPLITKIAYSVKENIEKSMHAKNYPINNNEIRKIAEHTTEFFVWKNKKKKPLVRTTIFDI